MLSVREATKSFGGLKAVDAVNLDVEPEEIAGLIGPNGAGKTTLFNLITGLYSLDAGAITLKNRPMHSLPSHQIAAYGIARTFQNLRLFVEMTTMENVMVAQHSHTKTGLLAAVLKSRSYRNEERAVKERALELLDLVGLGPLAGVAAGDLSYGDQRRLEIARALALEPTLLLLDEPVAGMNETESRALMDLVFRIRQDLGITVLLIEHDMRFVMGLCDRVTVLNFGRRLTQGTPQQIQRDPEVIAAYLGGDDGTESSVPEKDDRENDNLGDHHAASQ